MFEEFLRRARNLFNPATAKDPSAGTDPLNALAVPATPTETPHGATESARDRTHRLYKSYDSLPRFSSGSVEVLPDGRAVALVQTPWSEYCAIELSESPRLLFCLSCKAPSDNHEHLTNAELLLEDFLKDMACRDQAPSETRLQHHSARSTTPHSHQAPLERHQPAQKVYDAYDHFLSPQTAKARSLIEGGGLIVAKAPSGEIYGFNPNSMSHDFTLFPDPAKTSQKSLNTANYLFGGLPVY